MVVNFNYFAVNLVRFIMVLNFRELFQATASDFIRWTSTSFSVVVSLLDKIPVAAQWEGEDEANGGALDIHQKVNMH